MPHITRPQAQAFEHAYGVATNEMKEQELSDRSIKVLVTTFLAIEYGLDYRPLRSMWADQYGRWRALATLYTESQAGRRMPLRVFMRGLQQVCQRIDPDQCGDLFDAVHRYLPFLNTFLAKGPTEVRSQIAASTDPMAPLPYTHLDLVKETIIIPRSVRIPIQNAIQSRIRERERNLIRGSDGTS